MMDMSTLAGVVLIEVGFFYEVLVP